MHQILHEYLCAKKVFNDARASLHDKEKLAIQMLSGHEKQQLDFELSSQELILYGLLVPITNVKVTNKKMYNGVTYKYITNSLRDFIVMKNFPGSQEEKETFATEAAAYMWKNRGGKNALKLETTKAKITKKRGFS
jgi:hypothetical protein